MCRRYRHCRNFRGGGRCQGVAAVVSLFSSSRRSHLWGVVVGRRKRGRLLEGIGRRGARGGRAPARLKLTRTPPLFVHSALSARSLAPRLLTLHCSLKSEAPQPAAAARAEHTVCGSASAGDPEPPPAPGPARRASSGTHPQRRLSPLATPRSSPTSQRPGAQAKGEERFLSLVATLSCSLQEFV